MLRLAAAFSVLQAKACLYLVRRQRARGVLLVGKHEQGDAGELCIVEQLLKHFPCLLKACRVGGVYDEEEAVCLAVVALP